MALDSLKRSLRLASLFGLRRTSLSHLAGAWTKRCHRQFQNRRHDDELVIENRADLCLYLGEPDTIEFQPSDLQLRGQLSWVNRAFTRARAIAGPVTLSSRVLFPTWNSLPKRGLAFVRLGEQPPFSLQKMPSAEFNAERVLRHGAPEAHPIAQIVAVASARTGRAKLARRLAPEGGQDWLEYCRAAYRGEPGTLFGAVLLDVGEAAESLERAVWRLEHTQLGRGQPEARELLLKMRRNLAGTLGTLVEINGLMQNADAPRALERLFGAEDRLTDEPESMKNMPRYAEFLVELLRATKPP